MNMPTKLSPPTGYTSWLDYAVDMLDVRTAELEFLFDDAEQAPTRDEMRLAARAELDALRLAAEPVDIKAPIEEGRD